MATFRLPPDITALEIYTLLNKHYFKNPFTQIFFGVTAVTCYGIAGLWYESLKNGHDLSFPGYRPAFLMLPRNIHFSQVYIRLLHEFFCILIDLLMSKIHLKGQGYTWKLIALRATRMFPTDTFHISLCLHPGRGGGQGDTAKKFFHHKN